MYLATILFRFSFTPLIRCFFSFFFLFEREENKAGPLKRDEIKKKKKKMIISHDSNCSTFRAYDDDGRRFRPFRQTHKQHSPVHLGKMDDDHRVDRPPRP